MNRMSPAAQSLERLPCPPPARCARMNSIGRPSRFARGAGSIAVISVGQRHRATARAMKRVEWPEPISTIARGAQLAHQRIGDRRVEARKPVLLEARRRRLFAGRRSAGDRDGSSRAQAARESPAPPRAKIGFSAGYEPGASTERRSDRDDEAARAARCGRQGIQADRSSGFARQLTGAAGSARASPAGPAQPRLPTRRSRRKPAPSRLS